MLFFRALYFLLWIDLLSTSKQAFAQYQSIHKGTADRVIIFVHGLFGDPSTSFSAGPNNPSWPELMSTDGEGIGDAKPLSAYTIATFSYPAKCSDGLSIPEVANYLMRELQDKRVLEGGTKLYFIAHCLGAIVVKQMLIRAHNANGADRDLFTQTKGVFLIATPSEGSLLANAIKGPAGLFCGPLIENLQSLNKNPFLQTCQRPPTGRAQ